MQQPHAQNTVETVDADPILHTHPAPPAPPPLHSPSTASLSSSPPSGAVVVGVPAPSSTGSSCCSINATSTTPSLPTSPLPPLEEGEDVHQTLQEAEKQAHAQQQQQQQRPRGQSAQVQQPLPSVAPLSSPMPVDSAQSAFVGRRSNSPLRSPPTQDSEMLPPPMEDTRTLREPRPIRYDRYELQGPQGAIMSLNPSAPPSGSASLTLPAQACVTDLNQWAQLHEMQAPHSVPQLYRQVEAGQFSSPRSFAYHLAPSNPASTPANASSAPPPKRSLHSATSGTSSQLSSAAVTASAPPMREPTDGSESSGTPRSNFSSHSGTSRNSQSHSPSQASTSYSAVQSPLPLSMQQQQQMQQQQGETPQPAEYGAQRHRRQVVLPLHLQKPLTLRGGARHRSETLSEQTQLPTPVQIYEKSYMPSARAVAHTDSPLESLAYREYVAEMQQHHPQLRKESSTDGVLPGASPGITQLTPVPSEAVYSSSSDSSSNTSVAPSLSNLPSSLPLPVQSSSMSGMSSDGMTPNHLLPLLNNTTISSDSSMASAITRAPATATAQQVGAKRGGGISCHQCKTHKDVSDLFFCTNISAPEKQCHKKYCTSCIRRLYPSSQSLLFGPNEDQWHCPACLGQCMCAMCTRRAAGIEPAKRISKKKRAEAVAAAAAAAAAGGLVTGMPGTPATDSSYGSTMVPPPPSAALHSSWVGSVPSHLQPPERDVEPVQQHQTAAQLQGAQSGPSEGMAGEQWQMQRWQEYQQMLGRQQEMQRQQFQTHQPLQTSFPLLSSSLPMQPQYVPPFLASQPQPFSSNSQPVSPTQEELRACWSAHHPDGTRGRITQDASQGTQAAGSQSSHSLAHTPQMSAHGFEACVYAQPPAGPTLHPLPQPSYVQQLQGEIDRQQQLNSMLMQHVMQQGEMQQQQRMRMQQQHNHSQQSHPTRQQHQLPQVQLSSPDPLHASLAPSRSRASSGSLYRPRDSFDSKPHAWPHASQLHAYSSDGLFRSSGASPPQQHPFLKHDSADASMSYLDTHDEPVRTGSSSLSAQPQRQMQTSDSSYTRETRG